MYALIDCNNFYASCERVFRPDLVTAPIAILSNNDGCVIARSNEAKALGIPMGTPAFKFEKEFVKKGIHVFSSNYALYGDMSKRVMDVLRGFTPDIEIYSIDEAFLLFKGFEHYDLQVYGELIQRTVTKGTGIPISVGFAPTKALAKVANKIAKKYSKETNLVHVISNDALRIKALKWMSVKDVWGIGRNHVIRLQRQGVNTAYEFTQLPEEWVKKEMSIIGSRLQRELNGIPTLGLDVVSNKKSISITRSFDKTYSEYEELRERIATFAHTCGEKLRKQHSNCNSLMVFIRTSYFDKDKPQYSQNIFIQLPYATSTSFDLVKGAIKGLRKIFKPGFQYKKAGVVVMDIVPDNPDQLSLFEIKNQNHIKAMKVIDSLNHKFRGDKIKLGVQDLDRTWKMKQERLSPKYTTRLADIIKIDVGD